ncbi:MAG: hypothetical protein A2Z16_01655 [Chloroflexi bacterium RBG_16_54_18]|nr:MAG: hypothetical protein A2Z16_01655 [Chloroflexi bacterium RBG_16_54_18]
MSQIMLSIILDELRAKVSDLFGEQLESVILYGSHARGDARTDSDIDILIILLYDFDYFQMVNKVSYLTSEISLKYGVVISSAFITKEEFDQLRTPFLINIKQEGILV